MYERGSIWGSSLNSVPFRVLFIRVLYCIRDLERDPDLVNHLYDTEACRVELWLRLQGVGFRVFLFRKNIFRY